MLKEQVADMLKQHEGAMKAVAESANTEISRLEREVALKDQIIQDQRAEAERQDKAVEHLRKDLESQLNEHNAVSRCLLVPAGLGDNVNADPRESRIRQIGSFVQELLKSGRDIADALA